jgi:preprotein translocase subunit Sec61beta
MAGDGKIHMPGGMGGLVRYDEEYNSRFMLTPMHVVAFIVLIILCVVGAKIFLPVG